MTIERSTLSIVGLLLLAACGRTARPSESAAQQVQAAETTTTRSALVALPVQPASSPAAPARNPFEGARFFVDPDYASKVEQTATDHPALAQQLRQVASHPTALWIDSIAKVERVPEWLAQAEAARADGAPVVPVFVVYNLPNRDCSAKSSAGELSAANGGEQRYRTEFIDRIAAHLQAHPEQPSVVILEPDSLPNLATNLGVPKCAESEALYKHSVAYAIAKLSLPHVHVYLDAAHAGWLGWNGNRAAMAGIYQEVLTLAGGADRIRGFVTNVSNYNPIAGDDGQKLEPSNPCPNELVYVQKLAESLAEVGITDKGFIIDTSRNGRGGVRSTWGNWCNIRGAGLGERPRVAPAPLVDAYFWVKPPGDSDGTSDPRAARFDANCTSSDAAPGAPEAGAWFTSHFVELVQNANPPL